MKVKFINYLEVFQIVKILCSGRIFDEIYYFDISKIGKMLLNFLKLNEYVMHFNFLLDEVRDETGKSRFFKIYHEDLFIVCNSIERNLLEKCQFITKFGERFNKKKVILYFKKRFGSEIRDVVIFINVIDWYLNKNEGKLKRPIEFSIEHTLCFKVLKEFVSREYDIALTSYVSIRNVLKFSRRLLGNLYLSAIAIIDPIFYSIKYSHGPQRQRKSSGIPVLATQYTPNGLTFELTRRCGFFWLLKSKIPYEQVLFYFVRTDTPATDVTDSLLRKNGVKTIAMSKGATSTNKVPVYRPSMTLSQMLSSLTGSIFLQIFKELLHFRFKSLGYLAGALYFAREYSKAYNFYNSVGIKINVYCGDFGIEDIPKWLALEDLGGVSVSYQKSHTALPQIALASTADVYFQFGPYYLPLNQRSGNDNHFTLTCGFITDYSFLTVKMRSEVLRKKIMAKGAKFVLCYFDENSIDDRFSIIPNKKSAYVYSKLLNWVIADETIGLLCSPKRPKTLSARLPNIAVLREKAEATGRCIFMYGDYTASNYLAEVAQASDMAISLLLGGTAALESALAGCRIIYLDLEGFYSFPEYKLGRNTIVFDNLDNMLSAVDKYRWNPEYFDKLGNIDMIPFLKEKDPFRDGKAAERIGQYLYWLLDAFNKGGTREGAMKYANQNYAKMWGCKNVN